MVLRVTFIRAATVPAASVKVAPPSSEILTLACAVKFWTNCCPTAGGGEEAENPPIVLPAISTPCGGPV